MAFGVACSNPGVEGVNGVEGVSIHQNLSQLLLMAPVEGVTPAYPVPANSLVS